jgi:hypothetical protein
MQNDKNNLKTSSRRIPRVDETTAAITAELELDAKASRIVAPKRRVYCLRIVETIQFPRGRTNTREQFRRTGIGVRWSPLLELKGGHYIPSDSHKIDERAKRVFADLQREQKSRVQNPSLLLGDLKDLGMYGELSEDNCHINRTYIAS